MDEHSLHTPLVYKLYTEVIKPDAVKTSFASIETLRKGLLGRRDTLHMVDHGCGASGTEVVPKRVDAIAKNSLAPATLSRLYNRLIHFARAENVLELGTSLGINALYMAMTPGVEKLITIEGSEEVAYIAGQSFDKSGVGNIQMVVGRIEDWLPAVLKELQRVDFVLFDANHTYDATMRYFEECIPSAHEDSVFVFDDIYWSNDMRRAWTEIRQDSRVMVTLDLFRIGIVLFKKGLTKEDFVLAY